MSARKKPGSSVMESNTSAVLDAKKQLFSTRIDENNMLRIPLNSLNPHLICGLCQGYLYEACTITECMHSFCKNCIVKHLERSLNCPMCAILIHPTDPFVHIRLDGLLQDIVYALLPHVEKEELERERAFNEKHKQIEAPRRTQSKSVIPKTNTPSQIPHSTPVSHRGSYIPPVALCLQCLEQGASNLHLEKQFVRVTGRATIRSLVSFLQKKLHIDDNHKVDVYCPCQSGFVYLNNSHTLKAVKDLYSHDKDILHLNYDISSLGQ